MKIIVNGQPKDLPGRASLRDLVYQSNWTPELVIAELNGKIVDRSKWAETRLASGDRVELVSFVGGG